MKPAAKYLGIGLSTLYLWRKRPDFPPAVRLSPRAVGYDTRDLDAYLAKKKAA